MDTEHLMDAQGTAQGQHGDTAAAPPADLETVVVAVNAADLEVDPDGTLRWATAEAAGQAFAQGLALEPGHRTAVTHHDLAGMVPESQPQEWLDSLVAARYDLIDLSFLVFTARLEAPE
jgi:hypothetical protein